MRVSGIDYEDLLIIIKKMFEVKVNNGGKEMMVNMSIFDVFYVFFGVIVEMVIFVFSKIVVNLLEESVKFMKV